MLLKTVNNNVESFAIKLKIFMHDSNMSDPLVP